MKLTVVNTPNSRTRHHMVANVHQAFLAASGQQLQAGLSWYFDAFEHAAAISRASRFISTRQACGIIAALSPMTAWERNVSQAWNVAQGRPVTGILRTNVTKAMHIAARDVDPLCVLKGHKVRAFYALIFSGGTDVDAVCIDRHAFDLAVGHTTDDRTRKLLERVGGYELLADVYRRAAVRCSDPDGDNYTPSEVQAVTWGVWRDGHALVGSRHGHQLTVGV